MSSIVDGRAHCYFHHHPDHQSALLTADVEMAADDTRLDEASFHLILLSDTEDDDAATPVANHALVSQTKDSLGSQPLSEAVERWLWLQACAVVPVLLLMTFVLALAAWLLMT
jgi:hypothetical protein